MDPNEKLARAAMRLYSESTPMIATDPISPVDPGFVVPADRMADLVMALAGCHDLLDLIMVEAKTNER